MPFENEFYLSKDHGSYMAMEVYDKTLRVVACFSLQHQEEDAL